MRYHHLTLLPLPPGGTLLFLNSRHIVKVSFLATAENWIIFPAIFDILYLDYRSFISIFMCAFGHFCRFYPPFLYLGDNMVHDQHVLFKLHAFIILFFLMSCPEPPMCISGVGSFPVPSGGPLTTFPVHLHVEKLVLYSENLYYIYL